MVFLTTLSYASTSYASPLLPVDVREPLVRLAVVSYFDQASAANAIQKELNVLQHIETAMLTDQRTSVSSLDEYLRYRNLVPATLEEYRKQIQKRGLINPLTITTPNKKVFEDIVEYEVRQTQNLISSLSKNADLSRELVAALESAQKMVAVYNLGLGLRDTLEEATRSWQGVPVLGFLRSVGENVVNPLVRTTIYSEPVMNRMRTELRQSFAKTRQHVLTKSTPLSDDLKRQGFSQFEIEWSSAFSELDFLKPLKGVESSTILNLVISFFNSLPEAMKQDIVWHWINHPEAIVLSRSSPDSLVSFFKNQHPHSLELFRLFGEWLHRPKVKSQFQSLSPLPIWELTQSLAKMMPQILSTSSVSEESKLLGDYTIRNWWGRKQYRIQIVSTLLATEPNSDRTMSLPEFFEVNPLVATSVKQKIAQVVLHNAFHFGLSSIISSEVRIHFSGEANGFVVSIPQIETLGSIPVDQTQRFIGAVSRLPLHQLMSVREGSDDVLTQFGKLPIRAQSDVARFLSEPANVLWAMQLYQLQEVVGEDIVRSELKSYMIRHPNIVVSYFKHKWRSQISHAPFTGRLNRCQLFYK